MTDNPGRRLLVIGGLSSDTITTADGETHLSIPGGNAVYAAIGARLWGVETTIAGLIGDDYPAEWVEQIAAAGIDTSAVQRIPGPHQNYFSARYRHEGDREPYVPIDAFAAAGRPVPAGLRRIADVLDDGGGNGWRANDEMRSVDWRADPSRIAEAARAADACLIVPAALDRQREWVGAVRSGLQRDAPVLLDPEEEQGRTLSADDLRKVLEAVDVVLPSLRQVAGLGRADDVPAIAAALAALGPAVAVVKLGADGSFVHEAGSGRDRQIPAYPTAVKDPTGAGDAFCGGFAAGYLVTGDAGEAALRGSVSASFAVEGFGAFDGLRYGPADAIRRLQQLRGLATSMGEQR